ncbi:MAG: class I SAM-dependent methyltransferase [Euryarchaeota archaeon]|nr:class I SAM-dependent methyltransferase [Euryarchaeota archaeon]
MEDRTYKLFREGLIRDETFGERRPHALLIEVVSSGLAPRDRVLNLHCGMGSDSLYLAQEGFVVTAVGFCADDIEGVRKDARAAQAKITTHIMDPAALSFGDEEFDFIADVGCIFKVDKNKRSTLLSELYRTLRRGGRMFTMLPTSSADPQGATRSSIEEMFHPPFEILTIDESAMAKEGGKADHLYYYSILMEKV